MSEWWTYRLGDFLMFSPSTYQRMFALYNEQVWPVQWVALPLGMLVLWLMARRESPNAWRGVCAIAAAGCLWVAWAFHWQRYASIHSAAPWFTGVFVAQALVLAFIARPGTLWRLHGLAPGAIRHGAPAGLAAAASQGVRTAGLALLAFAILFLPWIGVLFERPWQQVALFGLTPDATVAGTLGLLVLLERASTQHASDTASGPVRSRRIASTLARLTPWVLPMSWCAASGATLWSMAAPEAWVLPVVALVAGTAGVAAAQRAPKPADLGSDTPPCPARKFLP